MEIKEMAEAHLRNVQGQIQELQAQRERIEADIQRLSEYLQQGVAELNTENTPTEPVVAAPPALSLPGSLNAGE